MKSSLKKADNDRVVDTLRGLLKKRADGFEIYLSTERGLSVEAKDAQVDSFKVRSSAGVGLRSILEGRPGFAYSTVLTDEALSRMVDEALAGSLGAARDEYLGFPPPPAPAKGDTGAPVRLFDPSIDTTSEQDKIDTALKIEQSARDFDPKVKTVRGATYSESVRQRRVVNSLGVDSTHSATFFTGMVMAVARSNGSSNVDPESRGDPESHGESESRGDPESQMGFEIGMGHKRLDVLAEVIGSGAAKRAVMALGGRPLGGSRKGPAVFENTVVGELLSQFTNSILASSVGKGKSMLIGKVGSRVASGAVNIYDDGLMEGGWASSECDSEGVARQRTPLVEHGVLTGYLYDTYWGAREGVKSTGNSARGGIKAAPGVAASNIYMEKGTATLAGLLKELGEGLFITELMGVHTVDTVSGDFSLGASGFRVEGGEISYPVRSMAVSGNLLQLLRRAGVVGGDMRFIASVGAPSVLFTEVDASG